MKKLTAFLLLFLSLRGIALADRYAEVMDTSQDAGRLTVRFIAMHTANGEKAGDCAVLTSPEGLVMVIDAGEPTAAKDVITALDAMGVAAIDMLIASHFHVDHVGGMPALIEKYPVRAAYASFVDYPSEYSDAFLGALAQKKVPLVRLKRGDVLRFGEEATVSVLSPGADIAYYDTYPEGATQFINDLSLVLMAEYRGTRMLFSGDLYLQGEKTVLALGDDLRANVFKVNHHGDDTSSGKAWRAAVSPGVAVITHNGMASLRVPGKFAEEGADVYHTFIDGCVHISSPGGGVLEVLTQNERATGAPW